jgi:hypothetical protein
MPVPAKLGNLEPLSEMPVPAKLGNLEPLSDPLGEGTGGDRPRVGAKAPARGGGRALPVLRTGGAERHDPSSRSGTRVPRLLHIL